MTDVFHYCKRLCGTVHFKNPNLYLYGYAGLGKTHLAFWASRQHRFAKGATTWCMSVHRTLSTPLKKSTFREEGGTGHAVRFPTFDSGRFGHRVSDPYVSSCLYSLVNTRICRRLPTILHPATLYRTRISTAGTRKDCVPVAGQLRVPEFLRRRRSLDEQVSDIFSARSGASSPWGGCSALMRRRY